LCTPATLFYLAVTLVPDSAADIESREDHFFKVNTRFFGGLIVFFIVISVNLTLTAGMPLLHPMRVVHPSVFLLGVPGILATTQAAHKRIMWFAIFPLLTAVIVNSTPSSLN
jgi:hypothetical protein